MSNENYKPKFSPLPGTKKDDLELEKKKIDLSETEKNHPADEITSHQVFEIPVNKIKPVNRRIFVVGFSPEEKRTKAGLIIPSSFQQDRGDDKIKRDYRRWFVVDVADDVSIMVPEPHHDPILAKLGTTFPRKLQRGDEVIPFLTEDMTDWTPPFVIDWDNGGMKYYTFEELEIAGVALTEKTMSEPMQAK